MLTCQICGRSPAAQVKLRRHVGMLLMQRFVRARPTLCRDRYRERAAGELAGLEHIVHDRRQHHVGAGDARRARPALGLHDGAIR